VGGEKGEKIAGWGKGRLSSLCWKTPLRTKRRGEEVEGGRGWGRRKEVSRKEKSGLAGRRQKENSNTWARKTPGG